LNIFSVTIGGTYILPIGLKSVN